MESGERGSQNGLAAQIWWTARLFDDETAGGNERVGEAQELLERHGWRESLHEPDLVAELGA